jgi:hypothetical protein
MNDVRLKLSPPWITYIHKLTELFDPDPQIAFNISESSKGPSVTLSTSNGDKAAALLKLLPSEKKYGNITLEINVDCDHVSNLAFPSPKVLFETAFKGNPVFAYAVCPTEEGYWYIGATYVVFQNRVVQFFNDNLNDCHGVISTLYQDIAAEIFEDADIYGVYYNTNVEVGNLGKPLGEWP